MVIGFVVKEIMERWSILNTIGNCDNFEPGKYDPYNLESTKGDNKPC